MNFESVRSIIDTYIKKNGVEAITGDILNNVLNTMLDDVDTAISSIEPSPGGGSGEGGVSEEDVLNILEKNNYITSSALSSYYTKAESDNRYLASSLLGSNTLIHSGNIGSHALPISGGNLTGRLVAQAGISSWQGADFFSSERLALNLNSNNAYGVYAALQQSDVTKFMWGYSPILGAAWFENANGYGFYLSDNGNVLVGTTTDNSAKLQVNGNIDSFSDGEYSGVIGFNRKSAVGGLYNASYAGWQIHNHLGTLEFFCEPASGSDGSRMVINENGNVTIGGSDLARNVRKLVVDGSSEIAVLTQHPSNLAEIDRNKAFSVTYSPSNDFGLHIWLNDSGTTNMQSAYASSYYGAFNLSLQPLGGNVLIGTAIDSGYKLDVSGKFRASDNVIIGSSSYEEGRLRVVGKNGDTYVMSVCDYDGWTKFAVFNNGNTEVYGNLVVSGDVASA